MQAAQEFVEQLSRKIEADEEKCFELCELVFCSVAKRLGYSASVQFLILLPYDFQKAVLKQSPGPDRSLTGQKIVDSVSDLMGVPAGGARFFMKQVWELLGHFAGENQLSAIVTQLPADIHELFERPESPVKHDFEQWLSQ